MNRLTEVSNLTKYTVEPIGKNLSRKLETYCYYDVCNVDELTTNENGVDIISHQLELKFEESTPVFISWAEMVRFFGTVNLLNLARLCMNLKNTGSTMRPSKQRC